MVQVRYKSMGKKREVLGGVVRVVFFTLPNVLVPSVVSGMLKVSFNHHFIYVNKKPCCCLSERSNAEKQCHMTPPSFTSQRLILPSECAPGMHCKPTGIGRRPSLAWLEEAGQQWQARGSFPGAGRPIV